MSYSFGVFKFNPYHDAKGRFASRGGGGGAGGAGGVSAGGKVPALDYKAFSSGSRAGFKPEEAKAMGDSVRNSLKDAKYTSYGKRMGYSVKPNNYGGTTVTQRGMYGDRRTVDVGLQGGQSPAGKRTGEFTARVATVGSRGSGGTTIDHKTFPATPAGVRSLHAFAREHTRSTGPEATEDRTTPEYAAAWRESL